MTIFLNTKDKRLFYTGKTLKENGFKIKNLKFLNKTSNCDVVVLEPSFKITSNFIENLPNNVLLFAGNIPNNCFKQLSSKKIKHYNYLKNKSFTKKNAEFTAEGVLYCLINKTTLSIFEQKILILGGGNVSKATCKLFKKLKLNFMVTTIDKTEETFLKHMHYNFLNWNVFKQNLKDFNCVTNTIPFKLFEKEDLNLFSNNANIFEIASVNCLDMQETKNINYYPCPSLPSKHTPKSAGELVAKIVMKFLKEKK